MSDNSEEKKKIAARMLRRAADEAGTRPEPAELVRVGELFYEEAKAYCEFIESLSEERPKQLYRTLHRQLSLLAVAGVGLSELHVGSGPDDHGPVLSWEERKRNTAGLEDLSEDIEELQEYWKSFGPDMEPDEARAFMVWDDLGDLYSDLKRGILLWETGIDAAREDAMWEWWFHFQGHWGEHLYRALQTVHEMRFTLFKD